jgi:hypothetical protein
MHSRRDQKSPLMHRRGQFLDNADDKQARGGTLLTPRSNKNGVYDGRLRHSDGIAKPNTRAENRPRPGEELGPSILDL